MEIDAISLEVALNALGQLLTERKDHHEVVAIGGGSLLLLGQIDRTTKDLDIVALFNAGQLVSAHPLPSSLLQAVKEIANAFELGEEWINEGPSSLFEAGLPSGFETRLETRYYGGLIVHLAGRFDQICFKLYAAVDQGPRSKHFADLKSLLPTLDELLEAKKWCLTQDLSEPFREELNKLITPLGVPNE